jgi:hypothetical protein
LINTENTIEIEGSTKPAMVASTLVLAELPGRAGKSLA